jgi:hypothetical protein
MPGLDPNPQLDALLVKMLAHRPGGPRAGERVNLAASPTEGEIRAAAASGRGPKARARSAGVAATVAFQLGLDALAVELRVAGEAASRGK